MTVLVRRTRERRKTVEEPQINSPERQTERELLVEDIPEESPRDARRKRRGLVNWLAQENRDFRNAEPLSSPPPVKPRIAVPKSSTKPAEKTRRYTNREPIKLREPPPPIARILDLVDPDSVERHVPLKRLIQVRKAPEPRQRPPRRLKDQLEEDLPILESFGSAIIAPSNLSISNFITGSEKPRKFVTRKKAPPVEPAMPILAAEKHDLAPLKQKLGRDMLKTMKRVEEREREEQKLKDQKTALEQKNILPRPLSPASQSLQDAMLLLPDEIVKEQNKKTKLIPEERILLAQLYHDNFLVYHVPRYNNPEYTYVYPNSSIKDVLLNRWVEELRKVGESKRTPKELEERIEEMVREVRDFRKAQERGWNSPIPGIQSSPSFILVNKVYEYIPESGGREINKILDKYELKLMIDREEEIVNTVEPGLPWKDEETEELGNLYEEHQNYNMNVLRKDGIEMRQEILKIWADRLEQLHGTKRSVIDIERKVCVYRKEYLTHYFSPDRDNQDVWLSTPAITLTENLTRCLSDVDRNMSLEKAMDCIKKLQEGILKCLPPRKHEIQQSRQLFDSGMNSCRTNRPHMSRRERHLLAMLYRLNYQDYEKFNLPVGSRKEPPRKSRKKELLVQWSAILTELGVSRREPDELASKISQYKNIVKNHKLCKREGINALFMKSEYKLRKVQRPLSPTTRMFDLGDLEYDAEATSEKIDAYMKECRIMMNYPYAPTPSPEKKKTPVKGQSKSPPKKSDEKEVPDSLLNTTVRDVIRNIPSGLYRFGAKTGSSFTAEPSPSPPNSNPTPPDDLDPIIDVVGLESPGPSNSITRRASSQNTNVENVLWDTYLVAPETEDTAVFRARLMAECNAMEQFGMTFLGYDVVDVTGAVTKMAISREESQRDVNFYIWTKYMNVEIEQPINFYVCYICEQMSTGPGRERHRNGRVIPSPMSSSGILAQQSLPTIAVDSQSRRVDINWSKSAPKHRCVAFLKSTVCDKLSVMSHMLKRTTKMPDDPPEEVVRQAKAKQK